MKPPYRVPSMAEIRAIKPNGYRVMSLFAGAGGSSLGYRMAGFRVIWVSEFIELAREVYRANAAPYTTIDERDIREVDPFDVMKVRGLNPGDLDMLDGSPPCSSFSMQGKRERDWGKARAYSGKVQRTDDLFGEYIRFVRAIQPRVFVAENVAGLTKGAAKGYFLDILRDLKACGYEVQARLLDAQWLGVPQQRARVIFIGVRSDLNIAPVFPIPQAHAYSQRDAFEGLDAPIDPECDITRFAIGDAADWLVPGRWSEKYQALGRRHFDEPSFTITVEAGSTSTAGVIHPTEKRKFSIAELKRICGFPDDFVLTGTFEQKWERLGRAVPPPMMAAIAAAVRDGVLARVDARTTPRAKRSAGRSTND